VVFKRTFCDDGNVINKDDHSFKVRKNVGHSLLIDVGRYTQAHRKALIAIFSPWENDGCKALTLLVKFNVPEAHVEIQHSNIRKSIHGPHDLLNGQKRKWKMAEVLVQESKVGHEANLVVFLGYGKGLCSPFRTVDFADDSEVADAFYFSLE